MVGVLVGCLPRNPRQNVHLGLPVQLMPEELSVLLNKGYAKLLKEKPVGPEECEQRIRVMEQERKANFEAQQQLYREDRRQEMVKQMSHIMEGKKAKRQRLLQAAGKDTPAEEATATIKEEEVCLDKVSITPTAEKHMLQQLFTENPWKREMRNAEEDWTYPTSEAEKVRCAVFQDLWEKQYYLTSGQKFGGDFLAYPGDPSRFHSFYIVMCVGKDQPLPALDIISMGRLGSNVRKTVLLASLDSGGHAQYTSLQWTGMS
ncbi:tRNA-splicing endonuclease subunit Sen34-like [Littorina saxatilis]